VIASAVFLTVGLVEHHTGKSITGFSFVMLAVALFAFGCYKAWMDEHGKLTAEVEKHHREIEQRDKQIEHYINSNRPEVYSSYSLPLFFDERSNFSWDAGLWLYCPQAVTLTNSGKSTAFDVSVEAGKC
jgi:hypothetical protein